MTCMKAFQPGGPRPSEQAEIRLKVLFFGDVLQP